MWAFKWNSALILPFILWLWGVPIRGMDFLTGSYVWKIDSLFVVLLCLNYSSVPIQSLPNLLERVGCILEIRREWEVKGGVEADR